MSLETSRPNRRILTVPPTSDRGRLSDATSILEHMIEALEAGAEAGADALGPAALLASIRSRKTAEDQAAADVLELAARWADLHPPESIHSAATFTVPGCEHEEPIAGPGAPLVAEFCVAELGTMLGHHLERQRRSSSATPSSCATVSPDCGRRSTPGGSRRGGRARSLRSRSTRHLS